MAHHRHQASLEGFLDFSNPRTLSADQRERASRKFYEIVDYFDEPGSTRGASYNRPRLIRLTYEYALSDESRDLLLQTFFHSIGLNFDDDDEGFLLAGDGGEELRSSVLEFADYLMDNFYLPRIVFLQYPTSPLLPPSVSLIVRIVRAVSYRTPQPSPAIHSAILMVQGGNQEYTTTPTRLSALRGTTLLRDHHRCVISRSFDYDEATKRIESEGEGNAQDDDGELLSGPYYYLEVAHIIPHSLMRPGGSSSVCSLAPYLYYKIKMPLADT